MVSPNRPPPHAWGRRKVPQMTTGTSLVHPHMRGEARGIPGNELGGAGSPPHTWGKAVISADRLLQARFTPTYVGKRIQVHIILLANPVHPHIRGEKQCISTSQWPQSGSPPHTWGRFTPTYVGKRLAFCDRADSHSVHPHIRGEKQHRRSANQRISGSPPHTWGKAQRSKTVARNARFTPTYVGKSFTKRQFKCTLAVHPHIRGEKWHRNEAPANVRGSPPHTWGKGLR